MKGKHLNIICVISIVIFLLAIHYLSDSKKGSTIKTSSVNSGHVKGSRVIQGKAIYHQQPPSDEKFKTSLIKYLSKSLVKNVDKNKITIRREKNNLGDTHIQFTVICDGECNIVEGNEYNVTPEQSEILRVFDDAESVEITAGGGHGFVDCIQPLNVSKYQGPPGIQVTDINRTTFNIDPPSCTCNNTDCYVSTDDDGSDNSIVPSVSVCGSGGEPYILEGCETKLCNGVDPAGSVLGDAGVILTPDNTQQPTIAIGNRRYIKDADNLTGVQYTCSNGWSKNPVYSGPTVPGTTDQMLAYCGNSNDLVFGALDGNTPACIQDCNTKITDPQCSEGQWCSFLNNRSIQENNLQSDSHFDVKMKCVDGYAWSETSINQGNMDPNGEVIVSGCDTSNLDYGGQSLSYTCNQHCTEPPGLATVLPESCGPLGVNSASTCAAVVNNIYPSKFGPNNSTGNMKSECVAAGCEYIPSSRFIKMNDGDRSKSSQFDMQDNIVCNSDGGYISSNLPTATTCGTAGTDYNLQPDACIKKYTRIPEDRSITLPGGTTPWTFDDPYVNTPNGVCDNPQDPGCLKTLDDASHQPTITCNPNASANTGSQDWDHPVYEGSPNININSSANDGAETDLAFKVDGCLPICQEGFGCINHSIIKDIDQYIDQDTEIQTILDSYLPGGVAQGDIVTGLLTKDNVSFWRNYEFNNQMFIEMQLSCNPELDGCVILTEDDLRVNPCDANVGDTIRLADSRDAPSTAIDYIVPDGGDGTGDVCNGHGTCRYYPPPPGATDERDIASCECDGQWHGKSCNVSPCSPTNPCLNGGTCNHEVGADTYTCTCAGGWEGQNCNARNCAIANFNHTWGSADCRSDYHAGATCNKRIIANPSHQASGGGTSCQQAFSAMPAVLAAAGDPTITVIPASLALEKVCDCPGGADCTDIAGMCMATSSCMGMFGDLCFDDCMTEHHC